MADAVPLALVTGAGRGLGLALASALLARGDRVIACARDPDASGPLRALADRAGERLELVAFDVTDDAGAERLEAALDGRRLHLAIANAGVYAARGDGAETPPAPAADLGEVERVFAVNTLGALRTANAVAPALRAAASGARGAAVPKLVGITSGMASIAEQGGGALPYRVSKAALNMAFAVLAKDWRPHGVAVAVINPGWVKTDMGGPGATLTPERSAEGMLREIGRLTLEGSGAFLSHDGRRVPW